MHTEVEYCELKPAYSLVLISGMLMNGFNTYQVIISSSSSHYIWCSSLAFPDESHKLEYDPTVVLHFVH